MSALNQFNASSCRCVHACACVRQRETPQRCGRRVAEMCARVIVRARQFSGTSICAAAYRARETHHHHHHHRRSGLAQTPPSQCVCVCVRFQMGFYTAVFNKQVVKEIWVEQQKSWTCRSWGSDLRGTLTSRGWANHRAAVCFGGSHYPAAAASLPRRPEWGCFAGWFVTLACAFLWLSPVLR